MKVSIGVAHIAIMCGLVRAYTNAILALAGKYSAMCVLSLTIAILIAPSVDCKVTAVLKLAKSFGLILPISPQPVAGGG